MLKEYKLYGPKIENIILNPKPICISNPISTGQYAGKDWGPLVNLPHKIPEILKKKTTKLYR